MGIGSILVAVALVLAVGAYLARPFRRVGIDVDRTIEVWVTRARAGDDGEKEVYCSQCGRR